jgi:hypothetical protein
MHLASSIVWCSNISCTDWLKDKDRTRVPEVFAFYGQCSHQSKLLAQSGRDLQSVITTGGRLALLRRLMCAEGRVIAAAHTIVHYTLAYSAHRSICVAIQPTVHGACGQGLASVSPDTVFSSGLFPPAALCAESEI